MWSASPANVPLLTVFIWSIEACPRHCPKSFRDEGGYHIVNIVNKRLADGLAVQGLQYLNCPQSNFYTKSVAIY